MLRSHSDTHARWRPQGVCATLALVAAPAGAQGFGEPVELTAAVPFAEGALLLDLDDDGDLDALSSSDGERLLWVENQDGQGGFAVLRVIAEIEDDVDQLSAPDINGDGRADLLVVHASDGDIDWYARGAGAGEFAPADSVNGFASQVAPVAEAVDLDLDGDLDVLHNSGPNLRWAENTDGAGNFQGVSSLGFFATGGSALVSGDLDADGVPDIVLAEPISGQFSWMKGQLPWTQALSETFLAPWPYQVQDAAIVDADGDGDLDVVAALEQDNEVAWFDNQNGLAQFSGPQLLPIGLSGPNRLQLEDVDADGAQDLVVAMGNGLWWMQNLAVGSFGAPQIVAGGVPLVTGAALGDIDGDGTRDAMVAGGNKQLFWARNWNGQGAFGAQNPVAAPMADVRWVQTADLDGDGDQDVLAASCVQDELNWYPNLDGAGTPGPERSISATLNCPTSFDSVDLDGDGDIDVLATNRNASSVEWIANASGSGDFGAAQLVGLVATWPESVVAADLNGDAAPDALVGSSTGAEIAWLRNLGGASSFAPMPALESGATGARSVYAADLDGDGDLDALAAIEGLDRVSWYPNLGGGAFAGAIDITSSANAALSVLAADLDGDGDKDVLSAARLDNRVEWFANEDGSGGFGAGQVLANDINQIAQVQAADLDQDGDVDVLATTAFITSPGARWFENLDGLGGFGAAFSVSDLSVSTLGTGDLTGDGFPEVVGAAVAGQRLVWFGNENQDCNGNGLPDAQEIANGLTPDCDGNGRPDECDIAFGFAPDCNANGVPDACDIQAGTSPDCNADGIPDDCGSLDCNGNGVLDQLDICSGFSADTDGDGLPDECDLDHRTLTTTNGSLISVASGGTQQLFLDADFQAHKGLLYVMVGSQSGIAPGLGVGGLSLPLNPDLYLNAMLSSPGPSWMPESVGFLSPTTASKFLDLTLPAGGPPALVGTVLHHAYVLLDFDAGGQGSGALVLASNPMGVQFLP